MRVLIAGIDGYLGWSLAVTLAGRGDEVFGIDNGSRREQVEEVGSQSVIPIESLTRRLATLDGVHRCWRGDLMDYATVREAIQESQPDAIVHLGEMPSAPYSMIDVEHAVFSQVNNVVGTLNILHAMREECPGTHLVKLGTMGEYGCYDDQTEILTENGWKLFSDLSDDDCVATRSSTDRRMSFKRPNSIHEYEFNDGRLYFVRGNRIDLMVTPNHRMFTSNKSYTHLRKEIAEDIVGKSRIYDIGCEWEGESPTTIDINGVDVDSATWLRFLGWYLAEGHCGHRRDRPSPYRVIIKQKDPDKAQEIAVLTEEIGDKLGTSVSRKLEDGKIWVFTVYGKDLAVYLSRFGKSGDKYIPQEVKALSPILLRELLSAMIAGDGWEHHRGWRYYSISKRLADDVQEVALKCGWACTISPKDGGYIVHLSPSQFFHTNRCPDKPNDGWEEYQGKVYCVNVGGDGIILVRRNGKPCWCGNTPNRDIPEAGPHEFPRQPGSFYHASKVHDSVNTEMACRFWGLRSTDIMQGVVYGTRIDGMENPVLRTRCDVDECFGTAIHRFCAQAVGGLPITPYGNGGQRRGFLHLRDSMRCLSLVLDNPPESGEYRVFNQFARVWSVMELAERVQSAGEMIGLSPTVQCIPNPRDEKEWHYYEPAHKKLADLGYRPSDDLDADVKGILEDMLPHRERIEAIADAITPKVNWK